ncbi:hypothetical protein ACHAXR_004061 [Thalassiosira sp. AJA248-18]
MKRPSPSPGTSSATIRLGYNFFTSLLTMATLRPASSLSALGNLRHHKCVTHYHVVPSLLHRSCAARSTTRLYSSTKDNIGVDHGRGDDLQRWYPPSLMDHMLYRIKEVNNVPYHIQLNLINFTVNGRVLGKVTPKVAERLTSAGSSSSSPIFELSTATNQPTLTLGNAAGTTVEQRTKAVASVMEKLHDEGYITGWRDELYPVAESFDSAPLFLIERAAASLLGVLEYGVHINGLVDYDNSSLGDDNVEQQSITTNTSTSKKMKKMWMARRSKTKSKFPGFLDHIVAGGQPAGLSLMDNVVKECMEEAGIPPEITRRGIQPAGAISYENYDDEEGTKSEGEGVMSRVVLFCFDLVLPSDFIPSANDGEVESFFTWGLDDIARSMDPDYDDPIKPNCYPVIIDYLLRSGAISPDSPKYLDILRTLRSGSCS